MNSIKENKKVLFVATVNSHIINFHIPYLKLFKEKGYEVHVCTGEEGKIPYCDEKYEISVKRNPYSILNNIKAIFQLKRILSINNYKIIHCHTPMGAVVTRLSAKKARTKGTKVIYTAHGFHFYKGAPIINWIIYYPIEKYLSKYTDCLITINQEDYDRAKKNFKKCRKIELVHGIGLDTTKFDTEIMEEELEDLKKEIGITKENIVLSYVAELNKNKNQILLIKCIQELIKQNEKYILLLVGDGAKRKQYEEYVKKNNLDKYVKFLGKRNDIAPILKLTNIYVASSLREGLPVNILEAIYMKLPVIATDNRGHREIIQHITDRYIINNSIELKNKIKYIINNSKERKEINKNNIEEYLLNNVINEIKRIYSGEEYD